MAAVAGLVVVSFVHFRERPREVEPMRFQIAMPENTAPTPLGALTVSPDALRLPSPLSRMAGRNFGCGPSIQWKHARCRALNRRGNRPSGAPIAPVPGINAAGRLQKIYVAGDPPERIG